jgi:hypothetical protein
MISWCVAAAAAAEQQHLLLTLHALILRGCYWLAGCFIVSSMFVFLLPQAAFDKAYAWQQQGEEDRQAQQQDAPAPQPAACPHIQSDSSKQAAAREGVDGAKQAAQQHELQPQQQQRTAALVDDPTAPECEQPDASTANTRQKGKEASQQHVRVVEQVARSTQQPDPAGGSPTPGCPVCGSSSRQRSAASGDGS